MDTPEDIERNCVESQGPGYKPQHDLPKKMLIETHFTFWKISRWRLCTGILFTVSSQTVSSEVTQAILPVWMNFATEDHQTSAVDQKRVLVPFYLRMTVYSISVSYARWTPGLTTFCKPSLVRGTREGVCKRPREDFARADEAHKSANTLEKTNFMPSFAFSQTENSLNIPE
jgi:hypothetical protein